MTDRLPKLNMDGSNSTTSAISLPESQGGPERLNSQDGIQLDLFGQQASHVNRFRAQDSNGEKKTSATFGRSSTIWLKSADLQLSLESRLRAKMDVNGSPEYKLTWKRWNILQRPPICRLQASVRRTSGIGCSGWRSPNQVDWKGVSGKNCKAFQVGNVNRLADDVDRALVGWPSPNHNTTGPGNQGREGGENLQTAVSGLIPPSSPAPMENGGGCLAEWGTPNTMDHLESKDLEGRKKNGGCANLKDQVQSGNVLKLNPLFSLWLMGYPAEWAYCVAPETV